MILYLTDKVKEIGGWPDAIGEDIVVTWRLMENGARVYFEPTAVSFTDAPEQARHFVRQRARWARGMFEGIAAVRPWSQKRFLAKAIASVDLLIPLLDIGYAFIWVPAVIAFFFGYTLLVSMWTLIVLPLTMAVYGGIMFYQARHVFRPLGLRVRKNKRGYIGYLLIYQVLCSFASIQGYWQHMVKTGRRWK